MPTGTISVTIALRWWVTPYLTLLTWFAVLCRREPNWGEVGKLIDKRGVHQRVKR